MLITNLDKYPCPVCGCVLLAEDIGLEPECTETHIKCPECAARMYITLDFVFSSVAVITEIDLNVSCPGCLCKFKKATGEYRTELIPALRYIENSEPFWSLTWVCDKCMKEEGSHFY